MNEPQWGIGCIYVRKGERCCRPARTRGVCPACYMAIRHLIKLGKTTWDKEQAAGRVLPRFKRLRGAASKF